MKNRLWTAKTDELHIESAVWRLGSIVWEQDLVNWWRPHLMMGQLTILRRTNGFSTALTLCNTSSESRDGTAGGLKAKLAQQAAAAAPVAHVTVPHDDPEVDDEEPLVSSRSISTTPTSRSSSPPPSSSTSNAGSKGPQIKSSSFKTALSALEKCAEESKELQGWVDIILALAKQALSDKHFWAGCLATMVPTPQQQPPKQQQQPPQQH